MKGIKMQKGTVKWFDPRKGYGFIMPDGELKDWFVHVTEVQKLGLNRLIENQRVGFEKGHDEKQRNVAINLVIHN